MGKYVNPNIYRFEPINVRLREIIKNRGAFPNDQAVPKLFYLVLIDISEIDGSNTKLESRSQTLYIMFEARTPGR